jgi:hypothetical protein
MRIPSSARSYIVGKAGVTLKDITTRTGTKIQIPKQGETESDFIDISITGFSQGIKDAKEEIGVIVQARVRMECPHYRPTNLIFVFPSLAHFINSWQVMKSLALIN